MKNPLKNKPLRLPGQSLDDKLNDYVYDNFFQYFILILFVVILIILEWIRSYFSISPHPMQYTIAGFLIILFFSYKIIKSYPEIIKIKLGRDGERVVGQQLEELRSMGCKIFHDITSQDFNIDHVVVSPQGIFTVETKTWSKRNSKEVIKFNGTNLIVNGYSSNDTIIQSISEANWLKSLLKESTGKEFDVQPVTVFPGWFVDQESSKLALSKGLWLLNPKGLPQFIKNSSMVLSDEDQNLVAFHLTRYIYTTLN